MTGANRARSVLFLQLAGEPPARLARRSVRRGVLLLCLALAASPLGGCVSIGRAILVPKFRIDVPAAPLREVTSGRSGPGWHGRSGAGHGPGIGGRSGLWPLKSGSPTPTSSPERTDVQGQGDGSMKLDRVVVTGLRPIPHRAPDYSPEQVAAMVCITARFGYIQQGGAARARIDTGGARRPRRP